jgi:outer membrane protein assembly factor BamB
VFLTQPDDVTKWPPKVPEYFAGGSSAGGHAVAEKRSVLCFNRTDGKLLWQRDVVYKEPEITHPTNPFCSASPVTDGERVIASHGAAGLVCYDLDGKEQWRYDVGKIEHLWGTAASPILYENLCIVWCGPGPRQFLLALDKRTGAKVWETTEPGGDDGITSKTFLGSWSTPIVARVGDEDQLVFAVPHKIKGYDPRTGQELWSSAGPGVYCYSSPIVVDGLVIFGRDLVKLGGSGDISKDRLRHRVGSMKISTAVVAGDYLYIYGRRARTCGRARSRNAPAARPPGARRSTPPGGSTSPTSRGARSSSRPDRSTSCWPPIISRKSATPRSSPPAATCSFARTSTCGASASRSSR